MNCAYLGIHADYAELLKLLTIEPGVGAPFNRIRALASALSVSVTYESDGTLAGLYDLLDAGWPVTVSVETAELTYWQHVSSRHVVVVVGMDRNYVYLNDPEFAGRVRIPLAEFDLAWLAQGERYAVLAPSE